jgi:hypothetical protein
MASRRRSTVIYGTIVVVVALVAALTIRALWNTAQNHLAYDHCTLGTYELDTSQTAVAATMVAATTSYQPALPERAAVLALAAGLQESKLRNLPPGAGDRDSVGVLQQRPSQGWGGGDVANLQDVFKATTEFLDHLVKVDGWQTLPLAEAIQDVQISADGSAYAPHEPEATALADSLSGRTPAGVTCTFAKPTQVASATQVASKVASELPVNAPTTAQTTVTVPRAGWQTVAWFVAHADQLGIESVDFQGKQWTRAKGWHDRPTASGSAVVATMATIG